MMQLVKSKRRYQVDPWINIAKLLNISIDKANRCTQDKVGFAALDEQVLDNATTWWQDYRLKD